MKQAILYDDYGNKYVLDDSASLEESQNLNCKLGEFKTKKNGMTKLC